MSARRRIAWAAVIYPGDVVKSPKMLAWWGAGAVAVMAALAGCGSNDASIEWAEPASDESAIATGMDGPGMRHQEPYANEGEDAEVRGVVEIEGDCLFVALDEVGERYPVVWPAATSWDPETGRVLLPNGESAGHGDSVYGGGGYYYVDDVAAVAGAAAADLAGACVDNRYGEIAVVNNQVQGIGVGDRAVEEDEQIVESVDSLGLDGDWLVDELTVDGARIALDPSSPITVTVEDGAVSGTAACNRYMGAIDWSSEAGFGRFVVSELSWTKKGCEAQVMKVEQSFLTALQAVDSYEAADGLYVGRADGATNFHLVRAGHAG